MLLPVLAAAVVVQRSPADLKALHKYRYGLTAERIESMGEDAFDAYYRKRTPDADVGSMRGVAQGVYTDAYRENTGRRYRAGLPSASRTRLLALDKQFRFLGVLFARNEWLFDGGNAVDPEADTLTFAQAERRLYTFRSVRPDAARTTRLLAEYRTAIRKKARKGEFYGARDASTGRKEVEANLGKIDGALRKAEGLCRTAAERAVVLDFVGNETGGFTS